MDETPYPFSGISCAPWYRIVMENSMGFYRENMAFHKALGKQKLIDKGENLWLSMEMKYIMKKYEIY